jgi:hypothetical protein
VIPPQLTAAIAANDAFKNSWCHAVNDVVGPASGYRKRRLRGLFHGSEFRQADSQRLATITP